MGLGLGLGQGLGLGFALGRKGHRLGAFAEADVELLQSLPERLTPRVEEGLEALDLVRVAPLEHPLPTEARDVLVEALGRLAERFVVRVTEAEDGEVGAREDARRGLALQVAQKLVELIIPINVSLAKDFENCFMMNGAKLYESGR